MGDRFTAGDTVILAGQIDPVTDFHFLVPMFTREWMDQLVPPDL